ncbi:Variant surface glycoprotein [Trypanosoma congolense IL3000]|uniref:Variant surface glycoprotein n=1 Tax=Trypanosoma congolense (strain IL3000) TaxID=1068625 RepID=F9WB87_TRYCI|nr:Variant surface glycoprotein [Trypanosoma congolense IL3000]
MAFFMNAIAVAIFTCSIVKDTAAQGAQVQNNDNSEQFALLCRIYNVAKNPPIHHVDFQDPNKIVDDIDTLNSSLYEEKQHNETEHVGNSSDTQPKPTTTREAAVAQAILRRIAQKAHTILDEIRKVNATRNIEKVKGEFAKVILGEMMNESHLCDGALKDVKDRATACGNTGHSSKGASAGKNLVVDFYCLCAMRVESIGRDQDGIENVCGVYVGSSKKNGNHGWGDACPVTSSTMWASIKKECGKRLQHHPKSTKDGHEVLEDFLKHLELGGVYRWETTGKESSRKAGMLGTGVASEKEGKNILCDGKKGEKNGQPPGGVCVYYGPSDWGNNIPWMVKFKTALASADALNNKTATIQRDIDKLQKLLRRAEEIYHTTQVISEIQNPAVPKDFQTAAKRLTAYSADRKHNTYHFILLFVLL